ncbi:Small conductance calcium-activated potassium channel protein 1 [Phytophthora citrophthora]|uniref:Small conductance calcium-activated potassium channel protein 1 n=1 Tax=Phytophthora citrophthora TaxID=4793 RepID=A0AAD9LI02_9STRA|nr:Small conductance calcium-activated potassium channel protein 1 [Phytophthora citrophthora]
MELQKARPQSDDLSDSSDQVYLKSTWVVTSLRHPVLRMLCCFVHLVLSFYLAVTSPLLTSLQSPPRFPVYGNLVKTATTGFTWQKVVFQLVMNLSLIVFLRIVAYPRLLQHHWNWRTSYHDATQTFSRLSRASASDITVDMSQSGTVNRTDVIALQTFVSGGVRDTPAVRLNAWIVGSSKGSWTFIAATFPFLWATVMWVVRKIAHGSDLEEWLFPEDMNEIWTDLTQNKLQQALSTALLSLSCLRVLVTLDWVLQDHEYTRVLFRNWLGPVRRVYAKFLAARILWCWFSMLGVAIGGVCFGAISMLQNEWIRWKLENVDGVNDLESWLSNASWNTLLSSLIIALDLLWVLQDWNFPSFTSPLGLRMFGLHVDHIKLRFPFRFQLVLSSKWIGGFLVMALLLPLEICQFLQIADYSPEMYAQHVHVTSFRVFPLNVTESDSSFNTNLDSTSQLILQAGSLSRYFPWSEWDRAPACIVLLLATTGLLWLSAKERCKMCFAVFLGLSGESERRAKVLSKISRSVPATVKRELRTQQRLRSLYKLRARSDSFCIWLAVFSVLTVWLQFRAIWRSSAKYHHDLPLQAPGEAYAALLLLITLILLHQVHYRYCVKLEIMVLRNQLPPDSRYSLWRSPRLLLLPFLVELLLCGVFLPPSIHGSVYFDEERYSLPKATLEVLPACPRPLTMTISNQSCDLEYSYPLEIVNMVVLLRLYWFARVIRNQLSKQLIADKATARPAIFSGKEVPADSLWWSFRISFALRPSKVLLTLFTTLWVSTAAAVSIFERPFPSKLDGEDHALWLTLVTMTGVGYGDAYSITLGGRIAIVLGAVVGGLAFMSLMTSEFLDSLTGTKREHAVLSAMDKLKWERSLRICGAQLIQSLWQCHRAKPSGLKQQNRRKTDRRLVKAVQQFKLCRKRKPMQSANASLVLQKSGLSAFYSREVETWMVSRQAKTAAQLDSLEQQMDNLESSLQPLLQVSTRQTDP